MVWMTPQFHPAWLITKISTAAKTNRQPPIVRRWGLSLCRSQRPNATHMKTKTTATNSVASRNDKGQSQHTPLGPKLTPPPCSKDIFNRGSFFARLTIRPLSRRAFQRTVAALVVTILATSVGNVHAKNDNRPNASHP